VGTVVHLAACQILTREPLLDQGLHQPLRRTLIYARPRYDLGQADRLLLPAKPGPEVALSISQFQQTGQIKPSALPLAFVAHGHRRCDAQMDVGSGCLHHLQIEPDPALMQVWQQAGQRRLVPRWAIQRDVQYMNLVAQGEIQAQTRARH